jgi:hypothetical protein
MNIRAGINWTKLVVALGLMCVMFSFGAMAQDNSNEPFDEDAAAALVEELADGLPDLIGDEAAVTKITDKWNAREDLVGKTQTQILNMLFADVKSVVRDAETQKNIWDTWTGAADQTEEEEAQEEEADEDWSTMDDSRKLNAQNVSWMLEDLQDELHDFIDNQAQIAAIVKKWRARKDLAGKTKADVTALLYADVKSIVKDKETLDDIEDSWKVSDAITNPSATKQQQEVLDQLKKHVFEEAENNIDTWKQVFLMLQLGGAAEYDPEAVAGFCLMREGSTPAEAWVKSLEGIVAFQKIQNRNLLPAEIEQMKEMTMKLMGCGSTCAAQHQKLKERAVEIFEKYRQAGMMLLFVIQLTDKKNMDTFLKGFVQEAYKEYQGMEFYDPYKIEAECRENGGDELGCFKSTYFGLFGYGLFGKQADNAPSIDQKSLDLVNRWQKERFKKFECVKNENGKCTEMKIKP